MAAVEEEREVAAAVSEAGQERHFVAGLLIIRLKRDCAARDSP